MEKKLTIHTLRSSSKGNSSIICGGDTKILVDCGVSGKTIDSCLKAMGIDGTEINAMVVTHEHTDHIKGVGILSRKYNIPIYANEKTWKAMGSGIGNIDAENRRVFRTNNPFLIGKIDVTAFDIPHDAAEPVGYIFETEADRVAVATDMGEVWESVFEMVKGCREILLEANYDSSMLEMGPYPYELKRRIKGKFGHLCNDDTGVFAVQLAQSGTKRIVLGHLSWENNYPDLAYYTVKNILNESGIDTETTLSLSVAQRDDMGDICPCRSV